MSVDTEPIIDSFFCRGLTQFFVSGYFFSRPSRGSEKQFAHRMLVNWTQFCLKIHRSTYVESSKTLHFSSFLRYSSQHVQLVIQDFFLLSLKNLAVGAWHTKIIIWLKPAHQIYIRLLRRYHLNFFIIETKLSVYFNYN